MHRNEVPNAPFEGEAAAMDPEQLQGMVEQMQEAFNRMRGAGGAEDGRGDDNAEE